MEDEIEEEVLSVPKLYPLTTVAKAVGYSAQHLRRLCRENRVAHTTRNTHFFFTEEDVKNLSRHVEVAAEVIKEERAVIEKARLEGGVPRYEKGSRGGGTKE